MRRGGGIREAGRRGDVKTGEWRREENPRRRSGKLGRGDAETAERGI